jgi:putative heme-binding domain-containing protein
MGQPLHKRKRNFIQLSQITDLDVDASGRLFLSAWDGAGYSGNPNKGFVVRAVPREWKYVAFPDLKKSNVEELVRYLKSESSVARLHAQQELLSRPGNAAAQAGWNIASDKTLPLHIRVAGIYTYAQAAGASGIANLVKLTSEASVREFALRALADRKEYNKTVPAEPFIKALNDPSVRVRTTATVGLGRLNRLDAAKALLKVKVPVSFVAPEKNVEGPHATPNSEIIPPHLAVRALVALNAVDDCVAAIGTPNGTLALWALRYMYDQKAVAGLTAAYKKASDPQLKNQIIVTLSRLYKKETPYEGLTWWGTRPDTHGPFYKGVEWEQSASIREFLLKEWEKADAAGKDFFADLNARHRMGISQFGEEEVAAVKAETKVDLNKIRNKKGQVGESSIEDVMLAMAKIQGDPALGKKLFTVQGCVACHSLQKDEVMKGPYMGQIGSIMNREQIAESILKPNASISQGFSSVLITAKGDKSYMGFVTQESADKLVMRNVAGEVFTVKTADIISRKELENSMMPEGLANALSYEEFASLLTFLSQQKK